SDKRAALSQPNRPNLRRDLQSRAPLVLAAAHAARGGAGVQGLRFGEGPARPLVCPHRIRGSDLAAQCAAAREHRNPHAGIFLTRIRLGRSTSVPRTRCAPSPTERACPSSAFKWPKSGKPDFGWEEGLG